MEQMPYQPHLAAAEFAGMVGPEVFSLRVGSGSAVADDWRTGLPVLQGQNVTLRELRTSDAPSLFSMLTSEEVSRFISPPPATVEEFERFIEWTHRKRRDGTYACFAVVPEGLDTAIGIFQIRALGPGFDTAEWGFALGSPFWGRGYFVDAARLVLGFAFDELDVRRLEARSCVENTRGNGALRKVGAVHEGVLRHAFFKDGRYHDQNLWSMLAEDWRACRVADAAALASATHADTPAVVWTSAPLHDDRAPASGLPGAGLVPQYHPSPQTRWVH